MVAISIPKRNSDGWWETNMYSIPGIVRAHSAVTMCCHCLLLFSSFLFLFHAHHLFPHPTSSFNSFLENMFPSLQAVKHLTQISTHPLRELEAEGPDAWSTPQHADTLSSCSALPWTSFLSREDKAGHHCPREQELHLWPDSQVWVCCPPELIP